MRKTIDASIDYYQGAYGLTIRIDTESREWIECLKGNIIELIKGNVERVEIHRTGSVEISNLGSLVLLEKQDIEESPNIMVCLEGNNTEVVWSQKIEELISLVGLLEGLIYNEKPGHQYLSVEGRDEILIVIAYKELEDKLGTDFEVINDVSHCV